MQLEFLQAQFLHLFIGGEVAAVLKIVELSFEFGMAAGELAEEFVVSHQFLADDGCPFIHGCTLLGGNRQNLRRLSENRLRAQASTVSGPVARQVPSYRSVSPAGLNREN